MVPALRNTAPYWPSFLANLLTRHRYLTQPFLDFRRCQISFFYSFKCFTFEDIPQLRFVLSGTKHTDSITDCHCVLIITCKGFQYLEMLPRMIVSPDSSILVMKLNCIWWSYFWRRIKVALRKTLQVCAMILRRILTRLWLISLPWQVQRHKSGIWQQETPRSWKVQRERLVVPSTKTIKTMDIWWPVPSVPV